jgi:hypothetical protein
MLTTNKESVYLICLTQTYSANSDYTPIHCELREHLEHNNEFQIGNDTCHLWILYLARVKSK